MREQALQILEGRAVQAEEWYVQRSWGCSMFGMCSSKSQGTHVAGAEGERAGDEDREGTGMVKGFTGLREHSGLSLGEMRAAGRFRAQEGRELIDV